MDEKKGGEIGETGCGVGGGANLVLHHGFQACEMLLQGKIPPHPPKTNKIRDEFVERDAGTRGYAYLPRICDSNTPPAVLDFRCSVSMTSMNKKGKKMRKTWSKSWGSRDASALDEMLTWVRSPDDSIAGLPLAGVAMGPKSLKISGWM